MRSWQIVEWGRPLRLLERETPAPEGTEVLVRVEACGVCHSDVHIRQGFFDMGEGRRLALESIGAALPFTMGHEIVGAVAAVGPQASARVGARVVVYPWIGCGRCEHCVSGSELDCAAMVSLGTRRAGGFADHVIVPHGRYLLDYGSLDPHLAATCACSGLTAYSALKKLPPLRESDALLIIGAGGLGLAALGLRPAITPARVFVADIDAGKLELARRMGGVAAAIDVSGAQPLQAVQGAGGAPRAVIDFVGSAATVDLALKAVGKGGTVIVVGLFGGSLSLSTALLPMRNLTLRGSYVGTLDEMRELLDLLVLRRPKTVPVGLRPMSEVDAVLDELEQGRVTGRIVATLD